MGRRPCTFKEADVTRAYKAAIKAGVMVEIKISLDRREMTLTPVKVGTVNTGSENDLDKWIREHDARVRLRGIKSIRKRHADGSFKTYYYAWKGGPPLRVVSRVRRNSSRAIMRLSRKRSPRRPACYRRCCFDFRTAPSFSLASRRAPAAIMSNR